MNKQSQIPQLPQCDVSKSVLLTGKCLEDFQKWFFEYYNKDKVSIAMFNHETMFNTFQPIIKNAYFIEWFDNIGITVDIMPRMNEDKVVFEPNTFCLKHEITTEDFVQFDNRFDAKIKAIEKANEIYNEYFV